MGAGLDQSAGANIMSLQIYLVPRLFHVNKQGISVFCTVHSDANICESILYNTCVLCAWVCVCVIFFSVWPFKRFLQGRGGREDNGSRHYLLLSCRLSIRPHTVWPSPTRTPSRCTCTHAPTRRMHAPGTLTDAHMHLCRDKVRAHGAR